MYSRKKIIDLRKRASKPLVVQRSEKMYRNVLQLKKISARSSISKNIANSGAREFDLRRKKISSLNSIYLPSGEKPSAKKTSRFKIMVASLAFVFLLNLLGIFGSGKQVMEKTVVSAFSGIEDLITATETFASGDFIASQNHFAEAVKILREAEKDLMVLGGAGAILETQTEKVQTGSRLITAGKFLASGGEKFARAADEISLALKTWSVRQQATNLNHSVESFSNQLHSPITQILGGISELENAITILNLVEPNSLPVELQSKVKKTSRELNYFLEMMKSVTGALPEIPNFLGDKIPRRYLLLFQNPDEIRPTGGFIGNIGILDLSNGFVKKFEIKNVYEIDGQLTQHLDPPEGFGFITGNWGLRDANYHPDFPSSAKTASFLFEKAGFGSVDGVIAVNSTLLTKLASASGGIKLERFEKKIPAEDLNLLLSLVIETKLDGADKPKQILNEVWRNLKENLKKIPLQNLAEIMFNAIQEKELQFSSENPDLQKIATAAGVENKLRKSNGDYLFVVNTSLSGNKSDKYCENQITHGSEISTKGEVINELKILRQHGWSKGAEKKIEKLAKNFGVPLSEDLKELLGRGRNIDLIKVFVPLGSELIAVEGIPRDRVETKISEGKTYFMFSLTVQPKFSREVILRYRLPKKLEANYSFLGEFQSGDSVRKIEKLVEKNGVQIFEGEVELGEEREWSF